MFRALLCMRVFCYRDCAFCVCVVMRRVVIYYYIDVCLPYRCAMVWLFVITRCVLRVALCPIVFGVQCTVAMHILNYDMCRCWIVCMCWVVCGSVCCFMVLPDV